VSESAVLSSVDADRLAAREGTGFEAFGGRARLDDIEVVDRHRWDLGNLNDLCRSIKAVGLLHPVVVTPNGRLIAGGRRVAAFYELGRKTIPVTVAESLGDARSALIAERDENTCRLDMRPSEKVALGRALEELERPRALERKAATQAKPGEGRVGEGNFSSPENIGERAGKVYDLVGEAVGMSGPTYKRAKAVVQAAEQGLPGAIEALEQMDATGKVTPAYDRVRAQNPVPREPDAPSAQAPAVRFEIRTERHQQLADAAKRRVERVVGTCNGLARGLPDLRVEVAQASADAQDVKDWIGAINDAVGALRALRKRIEDLP
jgi:ParB-like chromosome segregation protein Spo0J